MSSPAWWWCCCPGCFVLQDDFNRGSTTDIGAAWWEVEEDSEIVAGELQIPVDGAVATVNQTGESDPWMKVIATCIDLQPGKIYRVLCNYAGDETGGIFYAAEYECQSSGQGYLRAISGNTSGSKTVLHERSVSYIAGIDADLVACRTLEGLYATIDFASTVAWDCVSDNGGRRAGLMNGSASYAVEFDDFSFLRGVDGSSGERCFHCDCECEGYCLPDTLYITATDATGFCACFEGYEVELTIVSGDIPKWNGSATWPAIDCAGGTQTVEFTLTCAPDPFDWVLEKVQGDLGTGWSSGVPYEIALPFSVSCNPLSVVFPDNIDDAFTMTITPPCDPCECSFTLTLTE